MSDDANAGERAQAAGDNVAGGASGGNGKKREREAGCGQTSRDNETRSETNDATAMAVAQAPVSGIPPATPAQSHEQATQDHCEHTQHRTILGRPLPVESLIFYYVNLLTCMHTR